MTVARFGSMEGLLKNPYENDKIRDGRGIHSA